METVSILLQAGEAADGTLVFNIINLSTEINTMLTLTDIT